MKREILIILAIFIVLLGGCLDDDSNLNYKDVVLPDSVIVTNLATHSKAYFGQEAVSYNVKSGNELQLDVEVKYGGEDELAYEWRFDDRVISTNRNLRYKFTKSGYGMLLVYRKNAGNATVYQFQVKITKPFDAGILVVGKQGGKTQLDYIERLEEKRNITIGEREYPNTLVTEYIEYSDIYPLYNDGEELASDPVKLVYVAGTSLSASGVQILHRDWKNSVLINPNTMMKTVAMKDEFVGDPGNLHLVSTVDVGATSLLQDETGKIFSRVNYDNGNPGTGRFVAEPLRYKDLYDVSGKEPEEIKADYMAGGFHRQNSCELAFLYEKDKNRILVMTTPTSSNQNVDYSCINKLTVMGIPSGCVDVGNFDKELVGIFLSKGLMPYFMMQGMYIFYKDGDDYYVQVGNLTPNTLSTPHSISYMLMSPDIKLPKNIGALLEQGGIIKMAADKSLMNSIFYLGVGKSLYSLSINGTMVIPTLIHEFEEEGNMTDFVITQTWEASGVASYAQGQVFAACFDNGDFRVVKRYYDPSSRNWKTSYWVNKNYDGGVVDVIYYNNVSSNNILYCME